MTEPRDVFLKKLEEVYGVWSPDRAKFGVSPYGKVAEDLCISSSQFTKLLSDTATNGMYIRSVRNLEFHQERVGLIEDNLKLNEGISEAHNSISNLEIDKKSSIGKGVFYSTFYYFLFINLHMVKHPFL